MSGLRGGASFERLGCILILVYMPHDSSIDICIYIYLILSISIQSKMIPHVVQVVVLDAVSRQVERGQRPLPHTPQHAAQQPTQRQARVLVLNHHIDTCPGSDRA